MESLFIEKLNNNNYSTWREDIRVMLMEKGCWRIVSGEEEAPKEGESEKIKRTFSQRTDKAYSTIYLHIEKEYRPLISNSQDPVTAWSCLEEHFRPDSRARVVGLTDDYFSCRINPDEDIGLYGARLKGISTQLTDAGKPIPSWYQSFQLIRYLPPEFSGIVQAIYRWTEVEFTFDKVLKELVSEESRLRQSQRDQVQVAYHSGQQHQKERHNQTSGNNISTTTQRGKNRTRQGQRKRQPLKSSQRRGNETSLVVQANSTEKQDVRRWVFDTAATAHFCCSRTLMSNYEPLVNTTMAVAIGGVACPVEGRGKVQLRFYTKGELEIINLNNVLYSPNLRQNLISGILVDKAGHSFIGKNNVITVYHKNGRRLFEAKRQNGLYYVNPTYPKNATSCVYNHKNVFNANVSSSTVNNLKVWHRRFCHVNAKYIVNTSHNNSVRGLPNLKFENLNCESCKIAKSRRKSFKPLNKIRSNKPLQLLHMDLCGPLPHTAIGGFRYFLTITDDFSRKVTTYPLKEKRDVFKFFTSYQNRVERFLNTKVISVRTDQGLEFCSNEFEQLFDKLGIRGERTNTYTPEQNGVSERFNYTAVDAIKAILRDSGLDNKFWAEALLCFTYTWNRICHGKQTVTPFELFGGFKPSVQHFKCFGATAFLGVPKQLRKKLDMRAKKGIMVGYAQRTRGYRIWIPAERKIVESINVNFEESGNGAVLAPRNKTVRVLSESSDFSDSESGEDTHSQILSDDKSVHKFISKNQQQDPIPGTSELPPVPINNVSWSRQTVPRKNGSRNDIYYYVDGSKSRLRSHNDVKNYCETHNIPYDKSKFDFSVKNTFSGNVNFEESNVTDA